MMKDGVMMKDGKPVIHRNGHDQPHRLLIKRCATAPSSTTAGVVTGKDGTTTQLHEGDYVSLTGRVETRGEMAAQDSIQKLQAYDLKHPGKRKEMEKAREKADESQGKGRQGKGKSQSQNG